MLATAVIVISLIVQGLTLEPLVRLADIARSGPFSSLLADPDIRLASGELSAGALSVVIRSDVHESGKGEFTFTQASRRT